MSTKPSSTNANNSTVQSLKPLLIYAVVALAICLLCACLISLIQVRTTAQQQAELLSQQQVQSQALTLSQFMRDQDEFLAFLAQQPEVIEAMRNSDSITLRTLESQYSAANTYAARISLIPLSPMGTAAMDFPGQRLNSVETAMIIEANRGRKVPAEAFRQGRQTFISALHSVGEGPDHIEGIVLLNLDSQKVHALFEQIAGQHGKLSLHQNIDNDTINVLETGESDTTAPVAVSSVPGNSNWQLRFQASEKLIQDAEPVTLLSWVILTAAGLLLLAYGLFIYRRLGQKLEQQFDELAAYLHQLCEGERALPPALTLGKLTTIGSLAFEISQRPAVSGKPSKQDAAAAAELSEKLSGKKAEKRKAQGDYCEEIEEESHEKPKRELQPVAASIFRAYDIRGVVGEDLTTDSVYQIGVAIGSEAQDKGEQAVIVARDGRLTSEELATQLTRGLQDSGVDAIDLGAVPTPLLYFATQQLNSSSGVMVTGSHNPPEYNGLKVVISGKTLAQDGILSLKQRIDRKHLHAGQGNYSTADVSAQYVDYVLGDIAVAQPLKLVVDCGNGIAGVLAPRLFEELGCEVVPLYCDVDGSFPNHHPDPTVPANLTDLVQRVAAEGADLGIAFDGDGDRLGVVSASGQIISADRLLMLFAQDVVSRNPGCDVIFDVKCTRHLNDIIASHGGRPIMWKSGHSLIKQKMQETGALLGGEYSGHIFFKERWFGFDDGLYSAARLIEILSTTNPDLDQLLQQFPQPLNTPEIQLDVGDERKFDMMDRFANGADFGDAKVTNIDGIRVDLPDSWGLMRASNTTPRLILRFEAETNESMAHIKELFQSQLRRIEPDLDASFG